MLNKNQPDVNIWGSRPKEGSFIYKTRVSKNRHCQIAFAWLFFFYRKAALSHHIEASLCLCLSQKQLCQMSDFRENRHAYHSIERYSIFVFLFLRLISLEKWQPTVISLERYQHFEGNYCIYLLPQWWGQHVSSKRTLYLPNNTASHPRMPYSSYVLTTVREPKSYFVILISLRN
jgi:hypothetical protein